MTAANNSFIQQIEERKKGGIKIRKDEGQMKIFERERVSECVCVCVCVCIWVYVSEAKMVKTKCLKNIGMVNLTLTKHNVKVKANISCQNSLDKMKFSGFIYRRDPLLIRSAATLSCLPIQRPNCRLKVVNSSCLCIPRDNYHRNCHAPLGHHASCCQNLDLDGLHHDCGCQICCDLL